MKLMNLAEVFGICRRHTSKIAVMCVDTIHSIGDAQAAEQEERLGKQSESSISR